MVNSLNIDVRDISDLSAYPFTYSSFENACTFGFYSGAITALKLAITEVNSAPVSMQALERLSDDVFRLTFADAAGRAVGYWSFSPTADAADINILNECATGYIFNDNGVLVGHISFKRPLASILAAAMRSYDSDYMSLDSLILSHDCLEASLEGCCRSLCIDGINYTADTSINASTGVELYRQNGWLSFNALPGYFSDDNINGFTVLKVVNVNETPLTYDISDRHIMLRHGVTSNLRVVNDSNGVVLKGIKDA